MSGKDPNMQHNRARRHFLGLATAMTARIALVAAALSSSSIAHAKGKAWWKTGGNSPGQGHGQSGGPGQSGGHGQSGGQGQSGGSAMCFLRGTSIMTPTGEVFIEDLQIGDRVETVSGKARAVKWIGRQAYKRSGSSWKDGEVPIRISRMLLATRRLIGIFISPPATPCSLMACSSG